ncbi:MAG: hypothetical protein IKQ52_05570, partial [Bacteroidales bacterium]|nr:hypothetical protein [Bacteroidales bacterium]
YWLLVIEAPTLRLRLDFGGCDTPHTAAAPCVGLLALRACCLSEAAQGIMFYNIPLLFVIFSVIDCLVTSY